MNTRLLFTHALSPLHAGTGQGVGVIDLPVAREKATGIPFLPGSSLKGTLRDSYPDDAKKERVYGPDTNRAEEHAGAAQFTDQRLLLLPIRSLAGTFAWVTSPYLLQRFNRDAAHAGMTALDVPAVGGNKCCVVQKSKVVECKLKLTVSGAQKVVLEDLDLTPSEDAKASAWAQALGLFIFPDAEWRQALGERFCIVSDDVLSFLLNTATEITARIKLKKEVKTVEKGGLWYEEALPTETILYGLVLATKNIKTRLNEQEIFDVVTNSIRPMMQLGGKATVGRGLCRVVFPNPQPQVAQSNPAQTAPSVTASTPTQASTETMPTATAPAQTPAVTTGNPVQEQPAAATQPLQPSNTQPKVTVRPLGIKKPVTPKEDSQEGGA